MYVVQDLATRGSSEISIEFLSSKLLKGLFNNALALFELLVMTQTTYIEAILCLPGGCIETPEEDVCLMGSFHFHRRHHTDSQPPPFDLFTHPCKD